MKGFVAAAQTKGFPFSYIPEQICEQINCEKHVRFSNTAKLNKQHCQKKTEFL